MKPGYVYKGRYVAPKVDDLPAVTYTSEVYTIGGRTYVSVDKKEPGFAAVEIYDGPVTGLRSELLFDYRLHGSRRKTAATAALLGTNKAATKKNPRYTDAKGNKFKVGEQPFDSSWSDTRLRKELAFAQATGDSAMVQRLKEVQEFRAKADAILNRMVVAEARTAKKNPRRNPAAVLFSKPSTYGGRKRIDAQLAGDPWDGPRLRIEQVYGISKHGATKGQRLGPADLWECSRTGHAQGQRFAQGTLREMKAFAVAYLTKPKVTRNPVSAAPAVSLLGRGGKRAEVAAAQKRIAAIYVRGFTLDRMGQWLHVDHIGQGSRLYGYAIAPSSLTPVNAQTARDLTAAVAGTFPISRLPVHTLGVAREHVNPRKAPVRRSNPSAEEHAARLQRHAPFLQECIDEAHRALKLNRRSAFRPLVEELRVMLATMRQDAVDGGLSGGRAIPYYREAMAALKALRKALGEG